MPMTNAQKKRLLDHYYGATLLTPPAKLYIGVSTTSPTATGENFTEPSSEVGYARVEIDNDTDTWVPAISDNPSVKKNNVPIEFPEATGDWGIIKYWGIFEQETGGTCVDWAELSVYKAYGNGDAARIMPGEMRIIIRNPGEVGE